MSIESLPTLNACLNGTAFALVLSGWIAVKRGRVGLTRGLATGLWDRLLAGLLKAQEIFA